MILIFFLCFIILFLLFNTKSQTEYFSNQEKIYLLKNVGNNKCLYSKETSDIFDKNQDIFIDDCSINDKKFYWDIRPSKIKNKLSRKCLCQRGKYTNQYYCDASIDNLDWNILKKKNGIQIENNGKCLSSECGWNEGLNSCYLQKCDDENKNQYWNLINPLQKNYVSLIDNKNNCLTVQNGNPSDGIKPILTTCNNNDINQQWLWNKQKLKNRGSGTCLNENLMRSCNKTNTKWKWNNNSLENNNSKCLTSDNGIKLKKCIYTNKNQVWKEKAPFLKNNVKTSILTSVFSDFYYNLRKPMENNNSHNLFWDTRNYTPYKN